jgi:mRNA-degrading endonuclease RelE of RelBE toxin-antitoxin system
VDCHIDLSTLAKEEIRDLPGYVRAQARQLINELAKNPRPPRAKELRGKPNIYRIWLAGRWRIAYEIDDAARLIRILRVRSKEQIDYASIEAEE